ncbi:MAG: VCBS repeat-containing protein [Desulfovibrio sp.]|jgi:hypothetical protein|nr:VCBS repeat-containing protein [Desulfovibrio sp.]
MKRALPIAICLMFLFAAASAQAAERKETFVVLPFSIQGPEGFAYLERSIPQMFSSRLFWEGKLEPAVQDLPANQAAVRDEGAAEQARVRYKADYVIWGTVTVVGEACSLDVRVRDKAGKVWPHSREARTNQFIPAITAVIDGINREVFGRTPSLPVASPPSRQEGSRVNQMNPELTVNESSAREVYLNPQFRYAGGSGEDSRLRSQSLPYAAVGMEILDTDGDGKNEIFILGDDHALYAYRFGKDRLEPAGRHALPRNSTLLSLRSLPRPSSGKPWLIVNMADSASQPMAMILTFDQGFKEETRNVRLFLNVVALPPAYYPVLVGQQAQPPRLFRPGVHEVHKSGSGLSLGGRLSLPPDANALNFVYLPGSSGEDSAEKIVLLSERETLRVYTPKGARLSESEEVFSGSAAGLEVGNAMPGLSQDTVSILSMFYVPLRMLPVDLDNDGTYELIVNKPISTASMIFDRYRSYPQSEIHSLFWDGLGLNLAWKTRRIKGSMADYALADANNDGVLDLAICVNSHAGALGTQSRKAMVILYPLDLDRTEGSIPPGDED